MLPSAPEISTQSDRPNGLQIQLSRACITNCRLDAKSSVDDLDALLLAYKNCRLFSHTEFPNEPADFLPIPDVFEKHVSHSDNPYYDKDVEDALLSDGNDPMIVSVESRSSAHKLRYQSSISSMGLTYFSMRTDSFKKNAEKDVWCIVIDQFWMEFIGVPSSRHRPVPFVESFPVTIWIAKPLEVTQEAHVSHSSSTHSNLSDVANAEERRQEKRKMLKDYYSPEEEAPPPIPEAPKQKCGDLHMVVKIGGKVSAQVNHYQMLFLMRLLENVSKFQEELEEDTKQLLAPKPMPNKKTVLVVSLHEAEVALIGPPLPEMPSSRESQYDITVTDDDDMTINTLTEADSEPKLSEPKLDTLIQQNTEDSALGGSVNSTNQPEPTPDHALDNGVINNAMLNGNMHNMDNNISGENSPQIFISDSTPHVANSDMHLSDPGTGGANTPLGWSPSRGSINKKKEADIKKSFNSAFSSLQRGLGSSVSKISEKVSKMSLEDGSDDWDSQSVRSGSDEDEDYILLRWVINKRFIENIHET